MQEKRFDSLTRKDKMNNTEQPSKSDIQEIPPHEFQQAFHPNYSYVDICRICYQRGKAKLHEHGFDHIKVEK